MAGRILIADDDDDHRAIITALLNSSGYETVGVPDGREALHQLSMSRFDLLVLDLSMPHVDGWTVLRQMRAQKETERVPVITFTANAFASDREKALGAGCNAFLTKPFDLPEFLKVVQRLLSAPTGASRPDPSVI